MTAEEFRRAALSCAAATESAHMDHPDFRINGKIFATLDYPDEHWGMVKLNPEQQRSFVAQAPEMFRSCNGAWGRKGCTNVHLKSAQKSLLLEALNAAAGNLALARKARKRKGPERQTATNVSRKSYKQRKL